MKTIKITLFLFLLIIFSFFLLRYEKDNTIKDSIDQKDAPQISSDIIRIGVIEPMSGAAASGGEMTMEGIQLAHKLYPNVLGKNVELVIKDNKSDRVEAGKAASELIEDEKVVSIIGSYGSSLSLAIGEVIKEAKIPVVGCSPTNPNVTLKNDYYFRVCFIDPYQGTVMAEYAVKDIHAKRAAVIYDTIQDYSIGLANYFMDSFKQQTENEESIVYIGTYSSGNKDFTEQIIQIQNAEPDVVFIPGNYVESAFFIKQARQKGINVPILGGDTWESPEFIEIGEGYTEGAVFSTHFSSNSMVTEISRFFVEEYMKEYNKEPSAFSALGFDAYIMLLDALKRGNSSEPQRIRDSLAQTKNFIGATGIITLDINGDAKKSAVIKTVEEGKFKYITFIE